MILWGRRLTHDGLCVCEGAGVYPAHPRVTVDFVRLSILITTYIIVAVYEDFMNYLKIPKKPEFLS